MEKAELDTQTNFQKKRGVAAQKKEARIEKEEAEKYQKLRQEFVMLYNFRDHFTLFTSRMIAYLI